MYIFFLKETPDTESLKKFFSTFFKIPENKIQDLMYEGDTELAYRIRQLDNVADFRVELAAFPQFETPQDKEKSCNELALAKALSLYLNDEIVVDVALNDSYRWMLIHDNNNYLVDEIPHNNVNGINIDRENLEPISDSEALKMLSVK